MGELLTDQDGDLILRLIRKALAAHLQWPESRIKPDSKLYVPPNPPLTGKDLGLSRNPDPVPTILERVGPILLGAKMWQPPRLPYDYGGETVKDLVDGVKQWLNLKADTSVLGIVKVAMDDILTIPASTISAGQPDLPKFAGDARFPAFVERLRELIKERILNGTPVPGIAPRWKPNSKSPRMPAKLGPSLSIK